MARSRLYSTDGSGFSPLSVQGGSFSSDPAMLINNGLLLPFMNGTGDRFLYESADDARIQQLATMDVNTTSLGEAPSLILPTLSAATIALNGVNPATITVMVKTSDKVTRVGAGVVNAGTVDPDVGALVLVDDGTLGDVVGAMERTPATGCRRTAARRSG